MQVEINLPFFPGFYNGYLELDNFVDEEITDSQRENINWEELSINLAKDYFDIFKESLYEELASIINLTYVKLESPKFYNYSTDKIVCNVEFDPSSLQALFFMDWDKDVFEDYVSHEFKSCDGFVSHYPNTLREWMFLIIKDIDDNVVVETILTHLIENDSERYDWCNEGPIHILNENYVLSELQQTNTL